MTSPTLDVHERLDREARASIVHAAAHVATDAPPFPAFDFESAVNFLRNPRNNDAGIFRAAFQCLADNMHRVAELSDAAMLVATINRLIAHGLIRAGGTVCGTCPLHGRAAPWR